MKRILIYDNTLLGHHLNYLLSLWNLLKENQGSEIHIIFCVPNEFNNYISNRRMC